MMNFTFVVNFTGKKIKGKVRNQLLFLQLRVTFLVEVVIDPYLISILKQTRLKYIMAIL